MERQEETNVLAVLTETPLAIVINIMQTGQFINPPEKQVGEMETVIGEMTSFERALYTARESVADKHNAMVKERRQGGKEVDGTFKELHEVLDKLLWTSIKMRLGAAATEASSIGIRANFQIVAIPEEFETEILGGVMGLSSLAFVLAGLAGGGHKCATCADYDRCNNPTKILR